MLSEFYNKHPKLLVLTFVFAVIGLYSFVMNFMRIIILVEYCIRNPRVQPGMDDIICHLINQLK